MRSVWKKFCAGRNTEHTHSFSTCCYICTSFQLAGWASAWKVTCVLTSESVVSFESSLVDTLEMWWEFLIIKDENVFFHSVFIMLKMKCKSVAILMFCYYMFIQYYLNTSSYLVPISCKDIVLLSKFHSLIHPCMFSITLDTSKGIWYLSATCVSWMLGQTAFKISLNLVQTT